MKKIITVILLSFLMLNSFGQISPMDEYERDMLEEYRLHNIANLTDYILTHKEIGKSEFVLDGKLYKLKVKKSAMSGGYIKNPTAKDNDWIAGESLQYVIKQGHREYVYTLRGNLLELWSDNLSFIAHYNLEINEVSIRTGKFNYTSSSYKMYGFDYAFSVGGFKKVQDWVVRDAIGRANSTEKIYE